MGRNHTTQKQKTVTGTYRSNPRGFGFVVLDAGGEDVFIPQGCANGALSGDKVMVRLDSKRDERGPSGVIASIVERGTDEFVACLTEHEDGFVISPLRRDLPAHLPLDGEIPSSLKAGDWVVCKLVYGSSSLEARLVKRLGKSGSVTGDLKAVCEEYDLPRPYTAAAERRAAELTPVEVKRHEFLDLDVFTIDPVDAKDFDDGISYTEMGNLVEIGVHIADVACYVPHGSALDKQAMSRAFTSYLPGMTIGMLPDALSTEKCSLREGEEKLAHTVFLTIDPASGEVKKSRRIHTLIKSRHRLNFDQVERVLSGEEEVSGVDGELAERLRKVAAVTRRMRQWRAVNEEFLPFESAEIRVLCSGKPLKLLGVHRVESGIASQMIEELMLAANVAVAKEMAQRKIRGFYRIHPAPERDALEELAGMARTVLRRQKRISFSTRKSLISFLKAMKGEECAELMSLSMVRCMSRALYSLYPEEHFGLGKPVYCHFTSPIRRYPDLLTHQQLLASDTGSRAVEMKLLEEILEQVNGREYANDQAGFAISDRLKMRLVAEEMAAHRGWSLECLVARASSSGLQLYLRKYGLMGYMDVERLGGKWIYDHRALTLENVRRQTRYRVGDIIYARPLKLDTVRGELLLKPAELGFI